MSAPLMVHGVVPADAPTPVAAPPHRRIAADGGALIALASPSGLCGEAEADAAEAVRHNALLTAYAQVCAVAPVRFGAVFADIDALAQAVAADAARHRAVLAHVADAVELGARIVAAPQPDRKAPPPAQPNGTPTVVGAPGGYLRRQAAQRDAARAAVAQRTKAVAEMAAALTAGARDWRAFDPRPAQAGAPARLAEIALLAPRDAVDAFRGRAAALSALMAADGLTLEITGPWPPYSFTEPDRGPDAEAAG